MRGECLVKTAHGVAVGEFIRDFGKRAWRRPLTDDEQSRLLGVFSRARAEGQTQAVAVQMLLQVYARWIPGGDGGSQRRLLAQAMTRIAPELPQTGSE